MAFTLVAAPAGTFLQNVSNGTTINLANLTTRSLSIKIVPSASVGSLKLQHNGHAITENIAPYALAGDTNGAFTPANLSVGSHIIIATPYSQPNLGGTAGASTTISFAVEDKPKSKPMLLTEENSDHAVAFNAATFVREPFSLLTDQNFSSDKRTRVVLFVTDLECSRPNTLVQAENSVLGPVSLPIEHIGRVPGFDWLSQLQVILPNGLENAGDVWISVSCEGVASNKARLRISQIGIAAILAPASMNLFVDSRIAPNFRLWWPIATRRRPRS